MLEHLGEEIVDLFGWEWDLGFEIWDLCCDLECLVIDQNLRLGSGFQYEQAILNLIGIWIKNKNCVRFSDLGFFFLLVLFFSSCFNSSSLPTFFRLMSIVLIQVSPCVLISWKFLFSAFTLYPHCADVFGVAAEFFCPSLGENKHTQRMFIRSKQLLLAALLLGVKECEHLIIVQSDL